MVFILFVLCFFVILCGIIIDFGVLPLLLLRCIFYYRVPGLNYSGGQTGT